MIHYTNLEVEEFESEVIFEYPLKRSFHFPQSKITLTCAIIQKPNFG